MQIEVEMTVSHKLACVALESEISNLAIIFAATTVWVLAMMVMVVLAGNVFL